MSRPPPVGVVFPAQLKRNLLELQFQSHLDPSRKEDGARFIVSPLPQVVSSKRGYCPRIEKIEDVDRRIEPERLMKIERFLQSEIQEAPRLISIGASLFGQYCPFSLIGINSREHGNRPSGLVKIIHARHDAPGE